MRIGVIAVDGHNSFPNLALMRLSAWHKRQGDTVEWWNGFEGYDRVYMSKIFTFTPDFDTTISADEIITGGTGYKDYKSLRPDSREMILLDNNVLASDHGLEQIDRMGREQVWVDFNQGLDARLITPKVAGILAKLHWIRFVRLACDTSGMLPVIQQAVSYLREAGISPSRFWAYALEQMRGAARETLTYMRQMAAAPPLQADGLSGDYRLLAEFDNIVLAGHERGGGCGVEFITWERIQNGAGLWQGHYYENDYAGAKQDFAVRSGMIMREQIFKPEQLTEVYRSIQETLDSVYPLTDARRTLLEEAAQQIEDVVPDLQHRVSQSNREELELAQELEAGGDYEQGQSFAGF